MRRLAVLAALSLLAGCVSGPDHVPPEMPLPAKFNEGAGKVGDVSTVAWWTAYRDPRLNSLVGEGLSENLTIQ
ncbi:hypothetical protein ASC97_30020, partial [Rhizobium sp. Root1203]